MTAANFQACLTIILSSEGGFTETLDDGSVATNLGITLHTLSGWLGHTATIADVEALTPEAVSPIYRADYWGASHCDQLPAGVDLMVFDCAVNSGVGRAIVTLQGVLCVPADGLFGPMTAAAMTGASSASVIEKYADARESFYRSLPTFGRFGHGWLNRLNRTAALAQQMVAT